MADKPAKPDALVPNNDALEPKLELELPSLEKLPCLAQELAKLMTAYVMRMKVKTHLEEMGTPSSEQNAKSAIAMKEILPTDRLNRFEDEIESFDSNYKYLKYIILLAPYLWPMFLWRTARERFAPSLHTRTIRAEVKSVFERLQFCHALHNGGKTYYENGHTEEQRQQGELLLQEAVKYSERLGVAMVNLEAQLKALDIMPELESDDVAQQLALLQADKSTLEKMMHTVGEVKLYLEATEEVDD